MSLYSSLPASTKQWIVANPPEGEILKDTFALETRPIPELKDGEVLIHVQYLSNDPAQRGWIQKDVDAARLYVPPIRAGDVMRSGALGKVLASKSDKLAEGDVVSGFLTWTEYAVSTAEGLQKVQSIPGLSPSAALSILGMTSLTAYFGLHEVGQLKAGQSVLISGAAGATGSAAVQIAKNLTGASRVIGIAGGASKCAWVKSLGADECLDYKSATFKEDLAKIDEVDVYFDNVGGDILNAVLPKIKRFGRVIACGSIASYNDVSKSVLPNWFEIIANRITVQGFIVFDYAQKYGETIAKLAGALKEGKLSTEGSETIRERKFEDIPAVWRELFVGGNQGKLITKLI